jgi:hypothetical protein
LSRRSALADRLGNRRSLSGRTWIALVAFALIGIVTMQLGLLKLNAGIGRALEHQALLQRENAALSIENSELDAGNRIESQAGRIGMTLVPSGALRFLTAHARSDASRGAAALRSRAPSSTSIAATSESTSAGPEGTQASSSSQAGEAIASAETPTATTGSSSASTGTSGSSSATAEATGRSSVETAHESSSSSNARSSEEGGGGAESAVAPAASPSGGAGEAAGATAASGGGETAPAGH